jgi:hypothetical protein
VLGTVKTAAAESGGRRPLRLILAGRQRNSFSPEFKEPAARLVKLKMGAAFDIHILGRLGNRWAHGRRSVVLVAPTRSWDLMRSAHARARCHILPPSVAPPGPLECPRHRCSWCRGVEVAQWPNKLSVLGGRHLAG